MRSTFTWLAGLALLATITLSAPAEAQTPTPDICHESGGLSHTLGGATAKIGLFVAAPAMGAYFGTGQVKVDVEGKLNSEGKPGKKKLDGAYGMVAFAATAAVTVGADYLFRRHARKHEARYDNCVAWRDHMVREADDKATAAQMARAFEEDTSQRLLRLKAMSDTELAAHIASLDRKLGN